MNPLRNAYSSRVPLSRRIYPLSLCQQCLNIALRDAQPRARYNAVARRAASSRADKPATLEQPDRYRPPSHPATMDRRRWDPRGHNQGTTQEERQRQQRKQYPHMMPEQGTFMHWFLTNRSLHFTITMGTLVILAVITATQSFIRTSPFSHLLPSLSSFPLHPINFITETLSVLRLHVDYETARANESREQKMLDAQKRRLWRRAHGLENLDAAEEQGIDIRGLVPWDDGLTNTERREGGRALVLRGEDMIKLGIRPDEDPIEFTKRFEADKERVRRVRLRGVDAVVREEAEAARRAAQGLPPLLEDDVEPETQPQQPKRKRKLYFGIW